MLDYNLEKRRFVIGGVAIAIVVIYMIRPCRRQGQTGDRYGSGNAGVI